MQDPSHRRPDTLIRRLSGSSRGLVACAAAAAAAFGAGCASADEASASRGMELAVQDDAVFLTQGYFDRDRGFDHLRALGVTRLRVNLSWDDAMPYRQSLKRKKPREVTWEFAQWDSLIDAAAAEGIRIHLSIAGPAPAWASGAHKVSAVKPNVKLWGDFAKVAAAHFKGRVDRWSVWNEPNWRTWLSPTSGSLYRALYLKAYSAIKKADPRAKVLIGETSPYGRKGFSVSPIAFLRDVACVNKKYKRVRKSCPRLKADGYAHHPYDFPRPPDFEYPGADNATMGTLGHLTRALDRLSKAGALRKNGGGKMPLYLTEFGYFNSGGRKISAAKRAKYLPQAYQIALENPRVKSQLQYLLVSPPKASTGYFFNTGLMPRRGAPYPQYRSLKRWYRRNRGKVKRPGSPISLRAAPVPAP
jgi:Cellulase (glycosyl hydrolase family 5)